MWQKIPGLIIIGFIAAIGGVTVGKTDWSKALTGPFEDGLTQSKIESEIDAALTIREISVQAWNALRIGLFAEGMEGVVIGTDGWLYTDEEFQTGADYQVRLNDSINEVIEKVEELEAMGTVVLVALLPDKSRVITDFLPYERPNILSQRYIVVREALVEAGIVVPDLLTAMSDAQNEIQTFLKADTHWTPEGARVVARELAPVIRNAVANRKVFETTLSGVGDHNGDLLVFLDTGPFPARNIYINERINKYTTASVSDDLSLDALFGDVSVPVSLVGTSYSAISDWNFIGFLQDESDTDISNHALEGQGPNVPMELFQNEIRGEGILPQVVVWEIPERYLTIGQ